MGMCLYTTKVVGLIQVRGSYSAIVFIEGNLVVAEDYEGNVIAEGVAGVDDTSVIQSALDYSKGGVLYLTKGTYKVVDLDIPDNTVVVGEGPNKTYLQAKEDGTAIIKCSGTPTTNKEWVELHNLTINGYNRQYSIDGLVFEYVEQPVVTNVEVEYVKGYGIKLYQVWDGIFSSVKVRFCGDSAVSKQGLALLNSSTYTTNANFFFGVKMERSYYDHILIRGQNNKFIGLKIHGDATFKYRGVVIEQDGLTYSGWRNLIQFGDEIAYLTDVVVIDTGCNYNIIKDLTGLDSGTTGKALIVKGDYNKIENLSSDRQTTGIEVSGKNNMFTSIIIYRSSSDGILVTGIKNKFNKIEVVDCDSNGINVQANENTFINGVVNDNNNHGIVLTGANRCRIIGMQVLHNDISDGGYSGIYLLNSSYNVIVGNHVYDFGIPPPQDYGVREVGTSDYNFIAYNYVGGNNIQNIVKVGVNTKVEGNIGYTTENKGTTSITGDGVTTTFTVDITHGLVSDKLTAKVACKKPATYKWYLVDTDADGTYETLRIEITFDTAPASGEVVEVYWEAEVV